MLKSQPRSRRQFLQLSGALSATALLAACAPPGGEAPAASSEGAAAASAPTGPVPSDQLLIHRRVITAKEGKAEELAELITTVFERFTPYQVTRVYRPYVGPISDPAPSNPNQIVIEHQSENVAAFDEASAEWEVFAHGEDWEDIVKTWYELAEGAYTAIENWTLVASYNKRGEA